MYKHSRLKLTEKRFHGEITGRLDNCIAFILEGGRGGGYPRHYYDSVNSFKMPQQKCWHMQKENLDITSLVLEFPSKHLVLHKVLNGLAPRYFSDFIAVYHHVRSLGSSGGSRLSVTEIRSKLFFGTNCPLIWGHRHSGVLTKIYQINGKTGLNECNL